MTEKTISSAVMVRTVGSTRLWTLPYTRCGTARRLGLVTNSIVIILLNEAMNVNSVFETMFGRTSGTAIPKKAACGPVFSDVVVWPSDRLNLTSAVAMATTMKGTFSAVRVRIMFRQAPVR